MNVCVYIYIYIFLVSTCLFMLRVGGKTGAREAGAVQTSKATQQTHTHTYIQMAKLSIQLHNNNERLVLCVVQIMNITATWRPPSDSASDLAARSARSPLVPFNQHREMQMFVQFVYRHIYHCVLIVANCIQPLPQGFRKRGRSPWSLYALVVST